MTLGGRHKEDIKAVLRRRYGSLSAFEKAKGLPTESVCDVLRGRSIAQTRDALVRELFKTDDDASRAPATPAHESGFPDDSTLNIRRRAAGAGDRQS